MRYIEQAQRKYRVMIRSRAQMLLKGPPPPQPLPPRLNALNAPPPLPPAGDGGTTGSMTGLWLWGSQPRGCATFCLERVCVVCGLTYPSPRVCVVRCLLPRPVILIAPRRRRHDCRSRGTQAHCGYNAGTRDLVRAVASAHPPSGITMGSGSCRSLSESELLSLPRPLFFQKAEQRHVRLRPGLTDQRP